MSNLKQKTIGSKSIVLKPVPARDARQMQMHLAALLSEPLAKALPQETDVPGKVKANSPEAAKMENMVKGLVLGASAFAGLFAKLDSGDADKLIENAAKFILVDGDALDENKHFTADTLFDLYEAIWFFYSETFGSFFGAIRSRFPRIEGLMSKLSSLQT